LQIAVLFFARPNQHRSEHTFELVASCCDGMESDYTCDTYGARTPDCELGLKSTAKQESGQRLNLMEGTIKAHLHNVYQKLAINNEPP
jgi:hypothetical protein